MISPNVDQSTTEETISPEASSLQTDSDVWVGAYLASYNHFVEPTGNWGNLRTEDIDWDAFTHLFYFSLHAEVDGSLSPIEPYRNMSPDRINSIVSAGHNNEKPVMFSIGGWGNYEGFSNAIKPANRDNFVSNIVGTMEEWGFDGVDIDMEPIKDSDYENYIAFINELHAALQDVEVVAATSPLISVVSKRHPELFAQIHTKLDQVNLMTYDLSGAWPGWVSWHNSAVYSGGLSFPGNGKPLPSIDQIVKQFLAAGIPASKLGIGIDFYGYVWKGGTGTSTGGTTKPNQSWDTPPTVIDNVHYHKIMDQYYQTDRYHWDDKAKAAYLTIDEPGSTNDMFITYDDERSVQAKFDYVRQKGLGGTIIWELGGGFRKDEPTGEKDKLLQSVKAAMNNTSNISPQEPTLDTTPPEVSITAPADGATVSGTVNVAIQASDNSGIDTVDLLIDGTVVQTFGSGSNSYSWNTGNHANHTCTLKARSTDNAGNTASSSVTVTVSNSTDESTGTSSGDLAIFDESLNSPWINASWSTTVDYNSTEQAYSGSKSAKITQNRWGGFSLHSGSWDQGIDVDPSQYEAIEVAVYALNENIELSLKLKNDLGQSFPKVTHGVVSANQWEIIRIPMSELNPNGQAINRIDLLETSGTTKTYFVDDLKLIGKQTTSGSSDTYVDIYGDQLAEPWINSSWSATVDFSNNEQVSDGSQSVKVAQNTWGAFSLRSGSWGSVADLNTSDYKQLEFDVYTGNTDVSFKVSLKSQDATNPSYRTNLIPTNEWVTVSIPISELNPDNNPVFKLNISEISGSPKTYYIDGLRFVR